MWWMATAVSVLQLFRSLFGAKSDDGRVGEQIPPSPGNFGEESRWIALLMSSLGEVFLLDSSSLSSTWDLAGLGDR